MSNLPKIPALFVLTLSFLTMPPPQALAHSGPMTFRVMALCGGFAMIFQCVFGSLGKLLSFSPLKALIEVYCGIFGIITVILEMPIEKAKFLNR